MKAYTVYQPSAYATVAGLKHYETRPRETRVVELGGTDMKCRECEFASVHKYPRNGNGNSAHVGHFGQEASFCNHPQCPPPGPLLFYGKTAPRYCPLKKKERK